MKDQIIIKHNLSANWDIWMALFLINPRLSRLSLVLEERIDANA